jgi:hypothetical protein
MNDGEVIFRPTPRQSEFLSCPAREVLFGGSAGSGKTTSLCIGAIRFVQNGLHRALVIRRSFPEIRPLVSRSYELYVPLGGTFNKQDHTWTFSSGATVTFGFLDSPDDRFRYQGFEINFLGFDELTRMPADGQDPNGEPVNTGYLYLIGRVRSPEGSGLAHEIRATTNSGGCGHHWVKQRWGIPDDGSASERIDPKTNFRRVFIPARLEDNPHLANTDYARSLDALSLADQKTLKEGRWDVYEGSYFSEWEPRLHVVNPFEVPGVWPMWRGADDGWSSPAAVLWFAWDKINDCVYVVRELYRKQMTPEVMAGAVLAIDREFGPSRNMDGILDAASFVDIGTGSRARQMNLMGCRWKEAVKTPGSRIAGASMIHARLAVRSDGQPGLKVFRTCSNLVRTLPALPHSRTNPDDLDTDSEDHLADALRYGLSRRSGGARMVDIYGI